MAFNTKSKSTSTTSAKSDSWKAASFINIFLPVNAGVGRRKLAGIPLRASNANEKSLHEWLVADASRIDIISRKMQTEFVDATADALHHGFDVIGAAPVAKPVDQAEDAALSYINLYLPTKDGSIRKLGAIALRANNADEMSLHTFLKADDNNIAAVTNALIYTWQNATTSAGSAFDLADKPVAPEPTPPVEPTAAPE